MNITPEMKKAAAIINDINEQEYRRQAELQEAEEREKERRLQEEKEQEVEGCGYDGL